MSVKYIKSNMELLGINPEEHYQVLAETELNYIIEVNNKELLVSKKNFDIVSPSYIDARDSFMRAVNSCGANPNYEYWRYVSVEVMLATLAPNGVRFYHDIAKVEY